MNAFARAARAGGLGSITTNLLHEVLHRATPEAPRVDLLGMQALAKTVQAFGIGPPVGRALYASTLAADLVTNAAYFALAALAPPRLRTAAGTAFGVMAGIGAVALPGPLGLAARTTARSPKTAALTIALYTAGGIVAGRATATPSDQPNGHAPNDGFFAGKHVVISGGTRGLGFVLAELLLDAGAKVTICGRSSDGLESAVAQLEAPARSLSGFVCDVRERGECERFAAQAAERYGPIDILINNAGVIEVGPLEAQTVDDYREAMDTHFWGPLYLTLALLPAMRARHTGSIVNIASIGGLVGVPHLAPYSASKFAQVGFTQALAAEVAADGVTVTSVTPGLMITGSPDHAIFKGQNRGEYAWFTLSDANPLLSVPVDRAARRVLLAIQRGEAQAAIGWTPGVAKVLNTLFPQTTMALLRVAARLLPAPGGIGDEHERREGSQSHSRWTQNPLTLLNRRAMRRANQEPPAQDSHD